MTKGGARAHVRIDRTVVPARPEALRGTTNVGLFAELETMLFLVDGNNLLWRAAHGRRAPFMADDGRDVTPLFRFITLLRRALGTYGLFAECVVCFDGAQAWASRTDVDPTYKGNRRYDDADLSFMGWLPEIRAALDCIGVVNVELRNYEADDVIATLTTGVGSRPVRILSTDRDYFQLISPTTAVVNVKARPALVTEADVWARYGVSPDQWCEFRALAGDPSDGIPGLRGVGPARAVAMLAGGTRLEDLGGDVVRWRELIRLRTDVPVGFEPTSEPTGVLPSASKVCAALGLTTARS